MGRPELHDALASIAAQTWPDIEVVVVAAAGPTHPPPPALCGRHPVRFVPGDAPRRRPAAANAGLDRTTGTFIGLLDDDDLYLAAHVETLVSALHGAPAAPAAYAIVREVDGAGQRVRLRAQAFSRLLLYQDCYIASNALLFRREALAQCRFDERLEICEDWDFWLQLAELGDFAFVPAETAVYRSFLGTSGTGPGAARAEETYRQYTALLAAKWQRSGREVAAQVDAAVAHALDLYAQERWIEAEAAADRVLASYPYEVAALNLKGTFLALRGNIEAALEKFRVAAAEMPQDLATRFNLAQALERSGRTSEAISEYDRILTRAPHYPRAAARKSALQRKRSGTSQ
jgi:tetratricopeptide (TPR) repeat protein